MIPVLCFSSLLISLFFIKCRLLLYLPWNLEGNLKPCGSIFQHNKSFTTHLIKDLAL